MSSDLTEHHLDLSTRNGTVQGAEEGDEKAPVLMWIAALDELLEKLSVDDFPFERVRAISGAGQVSCHAPKQLELPRHK